MLRNDIAGLCWLLFFLFTLLCSLQGDESLVVSSEEHRHFWQILTDFKHVSAELQCPQSEKLVRKQQNVGPVCSSLQHPFSIIFLDGRLFDLLCYNRTG